MSEVLSKAEFFRKKLDEKGSIDKDAYADALFTGLVYNVACGSDSLAVEHLQELRDLVDAWLTETGRVGDGWALTNDVNDYRNKLLREGFADE
ncbi:hypothetical protein [Virgibacillus pantothenticus]|uniref:hypothetical protein n=1 Tax=Virgibacillus pantothenticus TaxID=1473 RepID=UPI000984435A|nr:hypothetical protein [Virgibacillus pantothenticus]